MILSDPPCKDGNVQVTTAPLKPLSDESDQKCGRNRYYSDFKNVNFCKFPPLCLINKTAQDTYTEKQQIKINRNKIMHINSYLMVSL